MASIQQPPDSHEDQVQDRHHCEEGDVREHHARQVAPRVLPDCAACHCGGREVFIAVHKPQVVHATVFDFYASVLGLGYCLVVLKVDVNDLRPISPFLQEVTLLLPSSKQAVTVS